MPESEPKPKLIELVAPGAGQGWKAVLKSGKAVVVHEIPVPAAEAAAAIPRIQRLFDHSHPSLAPVLAWGTDPNGLWVAVEPNEGTPLGTILSRGPLTPPAAAALGAGLLSGVSALHEAGISMGGFGASAVRVNGNGEVRLSGHPAAAARGAPSQSDLRADVRSSGMAICAAFGVDPAGAPAQPNIPPGLVVTMRSMASGAMGPAADRAQGALREMASALLAPDRLLSSQAELALRAGGREMPPITPFLPQRDAPAPAAPPPAPREETPMPRAASYDAPPRPAGPPPSSPWGVAPVPPPPQPSTPPTPSPYAAPPPAPAPPPQATNPPAPAPPYVPPAPAPAPPAPTPTVPPPAAPAPYVPPAPAPAPYVPPAPYVTPPPAAAPYEPPPLFPERAVEPPHEPYFEPVTPAPRKRGVPEQTWTPASSTDLPTFIPAPVEESASSTSSGRKSTVARRPKVERMPSERPSWLRPAVIAVAVLLVLAIGIGVFVAMRGGTTIGGTPGASPTAGQSPKASPVLTTTVVVDVPVPAMGLQPAGSGIVSLVSSTFTTTKAGTYKIEGALDYSMDAWDNTIPPPRREAWVEIASQHAEPHQELVFGSAARTTVTFTSAPGLPLPAGTYTAAVKVDMEATNQIRVYGGSLKVTWTG
jgi:hypothetical protein